MVVGDHIGYRFEIMYRLGKGSFGQVALLPFCLDKFLHANTQATKFLPKFARTPIPNLTS